MKLTRFVCMLLVAVAARAQYKTDTTGAPPAEVAPAISALLAKTGTRILSAGSPVAEIWLASPVPSGPASTESGITLPTIPKGALVGVVRLPASDVDRRGQTIPPGLYTLRYADYPDDKAHDNAAPQRDFLVLSSAVTDQNPTPLADFDALMAQSQKISGAKHPLVLSIWKADSDFPGFYIEAEAYGVLQTRLGTTPVCITLVGKARE